MSKDPIAAGIQLIISERGLIQRAVAERAGYSQQQFSDMMNDRKTIKATDIVPISKALGVSVQEIYDTGARFMNKEAV
jgi:transcriptional regulator with XRE-family HTH domain